MLVPAAVVDLHDPDAAFDESTSEEATRREGAGLFHRRSVEVERGGRLGGDIGELGHARLHAKRHFILGDARERLGVAVAFSGEVVELAEGVEHRAARGGIDAGGVVEEQYGIALGAEGDAVVGGRKETAAPHAREERLGGDLRGEFGSEHDERGQVVALAAEAVGEPGTEARFAGDFAAGHQKSARGIVVDRIGMDGADDGDVVDDLGGPREQFADPGAALAVLGKLEEGGCDGEFGLAARHRGDALALADRFRQVLLKTRLERGFVVERIELRRPAVHMEIDDTLGGRREMREPAERWKEARGGR